MEIMDSLALKPEELVRKQFISFLKSLGFTDSLLIQEKALSELPHLKGASFLPFRRIDILAYGIIDGDIKPLILVECKHNKISQDTLHQALGYNHYIKAPFIAMCYKGGYFVFNTITNTWLEGLPNYDTLISQASCFR